MKNLLIISVIFLVGSFFSCMEKSGNDGVNLKLLASFEEGEQATFTASDPGGEIVKTPFATKGTKALRFSKGQVSWDQINQNWQEYDFFAADLYLEGNDRVDIVFAFFDEDTDLKNYWTRVNYYTALRPGNNTFKIPLDIAVGEKGRPGRRFRKDAVTQLRIYIENDDPSKKASIFLDNVRLEKDASGKARFDGLKTFSFGDPNLPLMGGFTRVTKDDNYTETKGYGWKNAQLDYPLDPFQPDLLYRSVINIRNGEFIVDLPNGKYQVFMNIDAPAGFWGDLPFYRTRQVFANGKEVVKDVMTKEIAMERYLRYAETEDLYEDNIFDKYVTPNYNEKQFSVDVTDGKLALSFQSDHLLRGDVRARRENTAIALSALIIYPAEKQKAGQQFLADVKERRREDFDNNARKTLHVDNNPEPALNQTQRNQGYVLFSRAVDEDIFPNTKPKTEELTNSINAVGAAGTIEPLSIAIRAYKDFGTVKMTATDFKTNDGKTIPSGAIKVGYVSNRLTRVGMDGTVYTIAPRYLMNSNQISIDKNLTRWFLAVVEVPNNAGKGLYKGAFNITFGNGEKGRLEASFEVVYDQALPKMDVPVGPWGIELAMPMWYGNEVRDFSQKLINSSLEIMRKTGFTTFTTGLRIRPEGKGKDLKLYFEVADSLMNLAKAYGMTAFVNYGSAFQNGTDGARLNVYGYPVPTDPKDFGFDTADALWKHITQLIDKHAQEKQWLPVFISTSDEPHIQADVDNNIALNKILKKYATPRVRFAGISSLSKSSGQGSHLEFCKAMDVANLNGHDQWAIDMLREVNTGFAFYNGGNRWTFGPYMFMLAQKNRMLFRVAWHWNCNSGNPYYALDGREDDFCWVNLNAKGELVTSLMFERLRRGVVDYRYLLALQDFAAKNPTHVAVKEIKSLLDEVLALQPAVDRNKVQRAQEFRDRAIAILRKI